MGLDVGIRIREHAADGFYGKGDMQKDILSAVEDGRGLTLAERRVAWKNIDAVMQSPNVRTTEETRDTYRCLKNLFSGYSRTKKVCGPDITATHVRQAFRIFTRNGIKPIW